MKSKSRTYLVDIVMQAAITTYSRPLVRPDASSHLPPGAGENFTRQSSQSSPPSFESKYPGPPTLQPSTTLLPLLRNRPFEQLFLRGSRGFLTLDMWYVPAEFNSMVWNRRSKAGHDSTPGQQSLNEAHLRLSWLIASARPLAEGMPRANLFAALSAPL